MCCITIFFCWNVRRREGNLSKVLVGWGGWDRMGARSRGPAGLVRFKRVRGRPTNAHDAATPAVKPRTRISVNVSLTYF